MRNPIVSTLGNFTHLVWLPRPVLGRSCLKPLLVPSLMALDTAVLGHMWCSFLDASGDVSSIPTCLDSLTVSFTLSSIVAITLQGFTRSHQKMSGNHIFSVLDLGQMFPSPSRMTRESMSFSFRRGMHILFLLENLPDAAARYIINICVPLHTISKSWHRLMFLFHNIWKSFNSASDTKRPPLSSEKNGWLGAIWTHLPSRQFHCIAYQLFDTSQQSNLF